MLIENHVTVLSLSKKADQATLKSQIRHDGKAVSTETLNVRKAPKDGLFVCKNKMAYRIVGSVGSRAFYAGRHAPVIIQSYRAKKVQTIVRSGRRAIVAHGCVAAE